MTLPTVEDACATLPSFSVTFSNLKQRLILNVITVRRVSLSDSIACVKNIHRRLPNEPDIISFMSRDGLVSVYRDSVPRVNKCN